MYDVVNLFLFQSYSYFRMNVVSFFAHRALQSRHYYIDLRNSAYYSGPRVTRIATAYRRILRAFPIHFRFILVEC